MTLMVPMHQLELCVLNDHDSALQVCAEQVSLVCSHHCMFPTPSAYSMMQAVLS